MEAYVYRHVRLDTNEVFYVGRGTVYKAPYERAKDRSSRNKHWKHIVGQTEYRIDIIMEGITVEESKEKEIEFIALYGRKDLGLGTLVNYTDGGENTAGKPLSEEHKKKISEYGKGRPKSEEHKKKIAIALKGKKNALGFKHPTEVGVKISERLKGVKKSEQHAKQISDRMIGNKIWVGRKHSEETKQLIKEKALERNRNKKLALFNSQTL